MKTIIVDGAAYQRRILKLLLESRGVLLIEEYSSLQELPGSLSEFDMVFVDAALFSAEHAGAIPGPIIVTAPEKKDSLLAEKIEQGAAAFLTKPFTREGLDRALGDVSLLASRS